MSMCGEVFTDNELDQLFKNGAMGRPDSNDNKPSSQARLFTAVRSPIVEPIGRVRLALTKGSNGER